MPDKGVGISSDRTERDRPNRQGSKLYVEQRSDWKAVISRYNGQEGSYLPRRRRALSSSVIAVAGHSQIAEGVSQSPQG